MGSAEVLEGSSQTKQPFRNHFNIILDLVDVERALTRKLFEMIDQTSA